MSCEIPTKAVVFVYRPVAAAKVPNALRLATEKAEKTILDRYRVLGPGGSLGTSAVDRGGSI